MVYVQLVMGLGRGEAHCVKWFFFVSALCMWASVLQCIDLSWVWLEPVVTGLGFNGDWASDTGT